MKPTLVVLVLGTLGQGSSTGQCQILCAASLGLSVWSYHAVHYLWLCLLGLGVPWRVQSVYKC